MSHKPASFGALGDTFGFQLRRAAAILQSALEADLAPLSLRASEATLLLYVAENPGRSQTEIGRELRVKLANLIPTVGRLVAAGLLERVAGEGRAINLYLTAAGSERVGAVRQVLGRQEERFTRRLSAIDRDLVVRALKTIIPDNCCGEDRGDD